MGARCIGIRAVEAPCPLICAVAVETAKTHGTTQLRRINFFQFIILWVSKKLNRAKIPKYRPVPHRNGNAVVTLSFPEPRLAGVKRCYSSGDQWGDLVC